MSTERTRRAFEITHQFAARLPHVRALLETDILAAYQGDPAARSIEEVRFCYPGITGITHHRLAHELYLLDLRCSRTGAGADTHERALLAYATDALARNRFSYSSRSGFERGASNERKRN